MGDGGDEDAPDSGNGEVSEPLTGETLRSLVEGDDDPSDEPTLSAPSRTIRFLSGAALAGLLGDLIQDVVSGLVTEIVVNLLLALGFGQLAQQPTLVRSAPQRDDLSPTGIEGTPIEPTSPLHPEPAPTNETPGQIELPTFSPEIAKPLIPLDPSRTPTPTPTPTPTETPTTPTETPGTPVEVTPAPPEGGVTSVEPVAFMPSDEVQLLATIVTIVAVLLVLWFLVRPRVLDRIYDRRDRIDVRLPDAAFAGLSAGVVFGALGGWLIAVVAGMVAAAVALRFDEFVSLVRSRPPS